MGCPLQDERPRTNPYDVAFTRYSATFTNGDPTDDVTLTVVTWSDMTVYEVGPAVSVDVNGVPALVVTTGGPETGITSWQQIPGTNDAIVDLEPNQPPPSAYIIWTDGRLTFTLTGPDAQTVTAVAQQLRPA